MSNQAVYGLPVFSNGTMDLLDSDTSANMAYLEGERDGVPHPCCEGASWLDQAARLMSCDGTGSASVHDSTRSRFMADSSADGNSNADDNYIVDMYARDVPLDFWDEVFRVAPPVPCQV